MRSIIAITISILLLSYFIITQSTAFAEDQVPSKTLQAARFVLNNPAFKKALILETSRPVSYPDQVRKKFALSNLEVAAICTFAMRIHLDERNKMYREYGVSAFGVQPSNDFWKALSGAKTDEFSSLADKIEKALGIHLEKNK